MTRLDRTVGILGYRLPVVAVGLIVVTLVASIAASNFRGVANAMVLIPAAVWTGELWRLITWPWLLLRGGLSLVLWLMLMFFVASDLARIWRARKFLGVVVGMAASTGLVVTLLGWCFGQLAFVPFASAWAIGKGLFIAWALLHSDQTVRFSFVLPIPGKHLVPASFVITMLSALIDGFVPYIPEFIAMTLMLAYMRAPSFQTARLKLRYRWLQLRMGRRKSTFRVVERDDDDPPRWMH